MSQRAALSVRWLNMIKYKELMEKKRGETEPPISPSELHVSVDTGPLRDRVNLRILNACFNSLSLMDYQMLLRKSKINPPTKRSLYAQNPSPYKKEGELWIVIIMTSKH